MSSQSPRRFATTNIHLRNSVFALAALAISSLVGVGDALASDPELEVGETETQAKLPVIPPGAAACVAEMATLAAPSKQEAEYAESAKVAERAFAEAQEKLQKYTAEYEKLGCDMEKGVWNDECSGVAKHRANWKQIENTTRNNRDGWQRLAASESSKRVKQFQEKLAKLNEMCPGGKLGTGTASEEAKPALQAEPAKPADQVEQDTPEETEQGTTDETEQDTTEEPSDEDNAALAFPDPTDEPAGGDNSGASETTDGDNSAAVEPETAQEPAGDDSSGASETTDDNSAAAEPDDTQEPADADDGATSEATGDDNSAAAEPDDTQEPADADDGATSEATGDDNSGAAEPDPDADFIATCNANPNCQLE